MHNHLFSGLRVLDVATVIAAPVAAMMLADFGADVIKVEAPEGDMLRNIKDVQGMPDAAADYMWQMDGHSKRGIKLNLKAAEGMAVLHALVRQCDVFITNQPPSVRQSLRTRYEDLRPLKPDMIYASLTAYGEEGPESARKGFDQLAYWARSGLMDLMRRPGVPPVQGLSGMGDHPTGVALYAGIVTALLHRERTSEGSMVHTSLLANGLWSCSAIAQGALAGGDTTQFRTARQTPLATMRVYRCSDDRWLQFNMVRDSDLLTRMFLAMDADHLLVDSRFATPESAWENRAALGEVVQAIIETRDSQTWLAAFASHDVPVNRIAVIEEAARDEQILRNRMATRPSDPDMGVELLVRHPIQITSVAQVEPKRPPRLGEHSEQILRELGYGAEEIAALRAKGVF